MVFTAMTANAKASGARGAERGAGIKAKPSESEDERSDDRHGDVMAGYGIGRAVLIVLSDTRAKHHRTRQPHESADRVDDARTGKVDRAVAESHIQAKHRQAAAAPQQVAVDRITDHRHKESVDDERRELPALRHRACRDRRRRIHKDHLKQEHGEYADIVHVRPQEESLHSEYPEAADGKLLAVQHGQAAQRSGTADLGSGQAAEHESESQIQNPSMPIG